MFVINEGNYNSGNGSLSFYSTENNTIYNDIFSGINNRDLGDIPFFFAVDDTVGYLVVNNSGTIEKVDMKSMESIETVTGLATPRQMVIYNKKGYVGSLFTNKITIIDLESFSVEGQIDIGCPAEALVLSGSTLFASHWSGGSKIVAIDLSTNLTLGNVTTGMEPESMVLDKNNKLWVLCTGGWNNEEIPQICRINTSTLAVEESFPFRTNTDNPSSLSINAGGDTLYYIDLGIRRMPITATSLPATALVEAGTSLFYKVAPAPSKGWFFVADAVDYTSAGRLLIYNKNGELIDNENTGIIPAFMCFSEK